MVEQSTGGSYCLCLPTHLGWPLSILTATDCSLDWQKQKCCTMKLYLLTMSFWKSSTARIRRTRQERKLYQSILLLTLPVWPYFHPRFLVWPLPQKRMGYIFRGSFSYPFNSHTLLSPHFPYHSTTTPFKAGSCFLLEVTFSVMNCKRNSTTKMAKLK